MPAIASPRPGRLVLLTAAALGIFALVLPAAAGTSPAQPGSGIKTADYVEVTGFLDSPAASFLLRQIKASQENGSAVLIIRLDSPGTLDATVQPVLHAMVESSVPILVWVAPGDAQAGSSAAALVLAAHRAVMSPQATIGPGQPVDLRSFEREGTPDDGSARDLFEEVAFDRGRSVRPAVIERLLSEEVPAKYALQSGLVDGIEPTVQELLQSIKGLGLSVSGERVTITSDPLMLRFVKMSLLERLTHSALRPEFAYLLLLVGLFGLIFELYNPGLGAGGVAGAAALGFSFFAFTALPVSWPAVAALLLALLLLTADLSAGRLGALTVLGGVALVGGTLFLYSGAHPAVRLSWWAGVGGIVMTVLFFISVMTSAIRARTAKPIPGADGILGAVGVARTDVAPDGQVMARGTLWRARTLGAAIGQGTAVKVKGVSGLMLMVEQTSEAPAQSDAEAPVEVQTDGES